MYIIHESSNSSLPNTLRKNEDFLEFTAILQTADKKNRNGRYYPRKVLEQAIQSPYVQERLNTKTLYCELNHPSDQSIQRQTQIDMNNIGVVVKELYWEGNNLMGKCETLPTRKGKDIMNLIKAGCRIAFSMRGQGQVHQDAQLNATVVEPGLCIITFDIVVSPSHEEAYLQYISESTLQSFTSRSSSNNRMLALTESANLAAEGELISIGESEGQKVVDYAQFYANKHKTLDQYYNFNESDEIISVSEDKRFLNLKNPSGTYKKVMAEDFVKKDIRNRIRNI